MMIGSYWWLIGAKVFFSGPWFAIFQIIMIVWDHRQHRDWRSSLLAIIWPLMCVSMIYVLQGSMDPPLFGIPLAILFLTAWWRNMWVFMPGVALYYAASAMVLIVSAKNGSTVHWPFLLLWPLSFALLFMWRYLRMRALFMAEHKVSIPATEA